MPQGPPWHVADELGRQVLKLAAGATTQNVLPFTELRDTTGEAVDMVGNVYVTDFHTLVNGNN